MDGPGGRTETLAQRTAAAEIRIAELATAMEAIANAVNAWAKATNDLEQVVRLLLAADEHLPGERRLGERPKRVRPH